MLCLLLTLSLADQIYSHDLPCPLCLLHRVCFVAVGLCLCMNLKNGIKTTHYGLMTLAALLGFATSLRQTLLHIAPGDPGYGHLFLGFHYYIWSAIVFAIIMGLVAVAMLFEHGFNENQPVPSRGKLFTMIFFLGLILVNGISTFVECGIGVCPANPIRYYLLSSL